MRWIKLMKNDIVDGEDVCVSLWVSGCDVRCAHCHNESTWDFNQGTFFNQDLLTEIDQAISKNGIRRNFSVLGGEPLCKQNRHDVATIVKHVRKKFPAIKIFCWTGHVYEDLMAENDDDLKTIFNNIDILIDGPYVDSQRDITLKLRGSANQRILHNNGKGEFYE